MPLRYSFATLLIMSGVVLAQEPPVNTAAPSGDNVIAPGTRIPLGLINSISTKNAAEGDRVYLETVFPIMANGRIVIPPGSWVSGTVTEVNTDLVDAPERLNDDPYGEGWLCVITPDTDSEGGGDSPLLDAEGYRKLIEG